MRTDTTRCQRIVLAETDSSPPPRTHNSQCGSARMGIARALFIDQFQERARRALRKVEFVVEVRSERGT